MSNNNDSFGAFLSGVIIGGFVGAITALLFAPQSGEETREVIKVKSTEFRDKAIESTEDLRVKLDKLAQDAQTLANDLSTQAQEKSQKFQEQGRLILEEQKGRFEKASQKLKKKDVEVETEVVVEVKEELDDEFGKRRGSEG